MEFIEEEDNSFIEMTEVVELLIQWKFSEEIQLKFLNAGTNLDDFLKMGLTSLQEYVPCDRERLRLIQCIFKHKQAKAIADKARDGNSSSSSSPITSDPDFNVEDIQSSDSSTSEEEKKKTGTSKHRVIRAEPFKVQPGSHASDPIAPEKTSALESAPSESAPPESTPPESAPPEPLKIPLPSRLDRLLSLNKFSTLDLKSHLCSTTSSAALFTPACNKNGLLTEQARRILVNVLSEYMLNTKRNPEQRDYEVITSKIYELFPKEPTGLYYVPPVESGGKLARGKLFDAVRNKINRLISQKVFEPLRKRKKTLNSENEDCDIESTDSPPSDVKTSLVLLKRSLDVTSEVEEKWRISADYRLKSLYTSVKKVRTPKRAKPAKENTEPDVIHQYFEEYKILRNPRGYLLLLADFNHLYKDESSNLLTSWPELQTKIQELAVSSKISDPAGSELVAALNAEDAHLLDENNKDAVLLQLLPSLCPPTARVTVGTKTFKPSILESRDAFITYTPIAANIDVLISERRKLMASLKAPIQPFMIFLGPTRSNIIAVYIVVDNVLYKLGSVLECVDACFKVFHSLCVKYPAEANHLWHFFHLHVFKIRHDPALDGVVPLSTKSFIAAIGAR